MLIYITLRTFSTKEAGKIIILFLDSFAATWLYVQTQETREADQMTIKQQPQIYQTFFEKSAIGSSGQE